MADQKISALTELLNADIVDGDLIPIVDISIPETKASSILELDKRWVQTAAGLINDAGTSTSDIWSADKIQSVVDSGAGTHTVAQFTPQTAPAYGEGKVWYDSDKKSLSYMTEEEDVELNINREMVVRVSNVSGATIANGKVVVFDSAVAGLPTIELAQANTVTAGKTLGLTTHSIEDVSIGYVTNFGEVGSVDTSLFSGGDELWLSSTVAGSMTNVQPSHPAKSIRVGLAQTIDAVNGVVLVNVKQTFSNFAEGGVFFPDSDGAPDQDESTFFWNDTSKQLELTSSEDAGATKPLIINDSSGEVASINSDGLVSAAEVAAGKLTTTGDLLISGSGDIDSTTTYSLERIGVAYITFSSLAVEIKKQIEGFNGTSANTMYGFAGMKDGGVWRDSGSDSIKMNVNGVTAQEWADAKTLIGDVAGANTTDIETDGTLNAIVPYAAMRQHNDSGDTLSLPVAGTYYKWATSDTGKVGNYWTYSGANDNLTAGSGAAGTYMIAFSASFDGSNTQTVEGALHINNTLSNDVHAHRGLGTSSPTGSMSSGPFPVDIAEGDVIDLRFTSSATSASIDIYTVQFSITRISK